MNANRDENPRLSDDQLGELLRSLPREPASPGFTAGVMARLAVREGQPPGPASGEIVAFSGPRRLPAWSGWLMAAAALLVCGLGLREWQHRREIDESLRRIAELRGQYQELASQIAELKEEASGGSRPVVYLGGNREVDLVLDLGRLAAAQKNPQPPDPAERQKAKEELTRLYQEGGNTPLY